MDHSRGEFDPGAIVPEAGIGADGAEDGVGGDRGGLSLLDEDIEDGADVLVAAGFESEGVRMAVDDRPVRQVVVLDDLVRATDTSALGVMLSIAELRRQKTGEEASRGGLNLGRQHQMNFIPGI